MKKDITYYSVVGIFFLAIIFSVRHIVNTTRIFIGYEESISPVEILWDIDREDSILRVEDPMYLANNYFLSEDQKSRLIESADSLVIAEVYSDSTENKGSILNLRAPYVLWKNPKNDTIKVFKNERMLMFIKKD